MNVINYYSKITFNEGEFKHKTYYNSTLKNVNHIPKYKQIYLPSYELSGGEFILTESKDDVREIFKNGTKLVIIGTDGTIYQFYFDISEIDFHELQDILRYVSLDEFNNVIQIKHHYEFKMDDLLFLYNLSEYNVLAIEYICKFIKDEILNKIVVSTSIDFIINSDVHGNIFSLLLPYYISDNLLHTHIHTIIDGNIEKIDICYEFNKTVNNVFIMNLGDYYVGIAKGHELTKPGEIYEKPFYEDFSNMYITVFMLTLAKYVSSYNTNIRMLIGNHESEITKLNFTVDFEITSVLNNVFKTSYIEIRNDRIYLFLHGFYRSIEKLRNNEYNIETTYIEKTPRYEYYSDLPGKYHVINEFNDELIKIVFNLYDANQDWRHSNNLPRKRANIENIIHIILTKFFDTYYRNMDKDLMYLNVIVGHNYTYNGLNLIKLNEDCYITGEDLLDINFKPNFNVDVSGIYFINTVIGTDNEGNKLNIDEDDLRYYERIDGSFKSKITFIIKLLLISLLVFIIIQLVCELYIYDRIDTHNDTNYS